MTDQPQVVPPRPTLVFRLLGLPDLPAVRRWSYVAIVDSLGTGLMMPLVIIYFTQQIDLRATEVGLAMSVAGLAGAGLVPVGGALVDRFGARPVVITAFSLAAVGTTSYIFARDPWTLTIAVLLAQMADASGRPAKHAFIAEIAQGETRQRLLAFNRSIRNAGYGLGGLIAALVLAVGSEPAFLTAITINAVSFLLAALLVRTISPPSGSKHEHKDENEDEDEDEDESGGYREVLRDRGYVMLAVLNVLVLLEANAFIVGMPLWVVDHTSVPTAMVGVLFTVNTIMIVLFQVAATNGLKGPDSVGRTYWRSGVCFIVAVAAYLLASTVSTWLGIALMVMAVLLHSVAELSASAGEWTISIGLAPTRLRGRYLSVFAMGDSAQKALGPLLVTFLIGDVGAIGWAVLAVLISGSTFLSAVLAPRHPRARTQDPDASGEAKAVNA